jgi:TatA/E family protein of Tat protein translocase
MVIAIVVLGPGKLPETGAALGRAIRGFRDAMEAKDEPPSPVDDTKAPADDVPTK